MTPDVSANSFDRRQGVTPAECDSHESCNLNAAQADPQAGAGERREEQRSVQMLSFAVLLCLQGAIWFVIGYFTCRWIN